MIDRRTMGWVANTTASSRQAEDDGGMDGQAGSTSLPKCGRTYSRGTCMGGRGINNEDAGGGVCDRCRLIEEEIFLNWWAGEAECCRRGEKGGW